MAMNKKINYLNNTLIPGELKTRLHMIGKQADAEGVRIYVVGGFVRDLFFKKVVWDIDIVAESDPSSIVSVLRGKVTKHPRYMTSTILMDDHSHIDFARVRKEVYQGPAELPVVSSGTMQDDLARRDFACNAMGISLNARTYGSLLDPFSGRADLKKKLLKVFHNKSFEDDPTRIFRAARFMGRYGLHLEKKTRAYLMAAIKGKYTERLSRQRIANEFKRIISESNPRKAISILSAWGVMRIIHPKLTDCSWRNIRVHPRLLSFSLAWFLHGKDPDDAGNILEDLRFDRRLIDTVVSMLRAANVLQAKKKITDSLLEEFCHEHIYDVALLKHMPGINKAMIKRLTRYRSAQSAFLNGADLHQLGYVPGKLYGEILHAVRRHIWNGTVKNRQDALEFVREHFQ